MSSLTTIEMLSKARQPLAPARVSGRGAVAGELAAAGMAGVGADVAGFGDEVESAGFSLVGTIADPLALAPGSLTMLDVALSGAEVELLSAAAAALEVGGVGWFAALFGCAVEPVLVDEVAPE